MTQDTDNWKRRSGVAVFVILAVLITYLALSVSGALDYLSTPGVLQEAIVTLGPWGPGLIVGLMIVAVVVSPLPSAPIALAAGATYGHTLGTVYVLIGAEIGAMLAFAIARFAGGEAIKYWLGDTAFVRLQGSQGIMMAIVFGTRLMPFISFDAVSYAAGLAPISFWRFSVATLAGILPASFLLAHFGSELTSADAGLVGFVLVGIGLAVLVPLLLRLITRLRGR